MGTVIKRTAVPPTIRPAGSSGESYQITIRIVDGKPRPDPYYAQVPPGAQIFWEFDGDWGIYFLDNTTPLEHGQRGAHGRGLGPPVKVAADVTQGHFAYAVSVYGVDPNLPLDRQKPGIFMDATCPEVIIGV